MNGQQAAPSSMLSAPTQRNVPRAKSPSHAAALAATARAVASRQDGNQLKRQTTQPLSKPPVALKPRRLSLPRQSSDTASLNDTSSIPPTTSLVSLFEQKSQKPPPSAKLASISTQPASALSNGLRSVLQSEVGSPQRIQAVPHVPRKEAPRQENMVASLQTARPDGSREDRPGQDKGRADGRVNKLNNALTIDNAGTAAGRGNGDQARSPSDKVRTAIEPQARGRQAGQTGSIGAGVEEVKKPSPQKPPALPPRTNIQRSGTFSPPLVAPKPISRTSTAPVDVQTPKKASYNDFLSSSAQSAQSVNATYRQLYPNRHPALTKDDELANAIVASSLASSRLSSPARPVQPPPPPSRRHSRHGRSMFHHHSRTPSPLKGGLRQTLRKQESTSSDEQDDHPYSKHHKKRLIRKHPNKHHEGDRKRWRDALTASERKRYEGVWAANKGLYLPPLPHDPARRGDVSSDQVSNIVTKEIWERSRLPTFELEAVWDLVDNQANGRLSKEEFVVGMWLIDQRLKGRKLPVKVTPTVWASVRGLQGIKIRQ